MPCLKHYSISSWGSKERRGLFKIAYKRLLAQTKKEGFRVIPHSQNLKVQGRIDYRAKTIRIKTPCFCCAIMTLAHELGHWEDRKRNGRHRLRAVRERRADCYGYQLYRTCGVPLNYREYHSA